jgi:hypothetical protein
MFTQFKRIAEQSHSTLVADLCGVGALGVMLFVGLHLPGIV